MAGKERDGSKRIRTERYLMRGICVVLCLFCALHAAGIYRPAGGLGDFTVSRKVLFSEKKMREDMRERPKAAITFDDGPGGAYTEKLLDGLKERGVKATFFLIGEKVDEDPELVRRIADEGHLIGNHTYSHVLLSRVSEAAAQEELEKTNEAIFRATGQRPVFMRPPYGVCSRKLEASVDMLLVRWSVDPMDWNTDSADEIVKKVVTKTEENDIILLHDCYESSVDAALRIIDALTEKGFEFVTVDELLLD